MEEHHGNFSAGLFEGTTRNGEDNPETKRNKETYYNYANQEKIIKLLQEMKITVSRQAYKKITAK